MPPYFNQFDIDIDPNAFGVDADFFSEAWGINPSGDLVVGTVGRTNRGQPPPNPESGEFHGFLRFRTFGSPEVRRFDFDNAAATSVVGCNNLHDIVGFFRDTQDQLHAFIRLNGSPAQVFDIRGFQPVTLPTGPTPEGIHNGAYDINQDRLVVGAYHDRSADRGFGFVAHANDPANPLRIDMRRELNNRAIEHTRITGINTQKDIVGCYTQGGFESTSFKWKVLVDANGRITTSGAPVLINYPGTDVAVTGISDSTYIAGNDAASSTGNTSVTGFFWRPDAAMSFIVDDDYLWPFQLKSALPTGLVARTFVGGVGGGTEVVGAYRKNVGNPQPNRRAFYGFFSPGIRWPGPREVPFYPPIPNIPLPFPPFPFPWSVPLFGGNSQQTQYAVFAFLLLQLSAISDTRIQHRLRTVILEALCEELKKSTNADDASYALS